MDATSIIAVAGLVTTLAAGLGAPAVQARLAARHEQRVQLRGQRATAYTDAISAATAVEALWNWRSSNLQDGARPSIPDSTAHAAIDARIRMYATADVLRAWLTFRETVGVVAFADPQRWDGLGEPTSEDQAPPYDFTNPYLSELRRTVAVLIEAIRHDLGVTTDADN